MFAKFQKENKLDTVNAVSYDFIWNDAKLGRSTCIEIFIKEYRIVTNRESTFYLHKGATAVPRNWHDEYLNDGSFKKTVTELTNIHIPTDHVRKLIKVANARKNAEDLLDALPYVDSQNKKTSLFSLAYSKTSNELLELINSSNFQHEHSVKLMELVEAKKVAEDLQNQLNSLDSHQNLFAKNNTDSLANDMDELSLSESESYGLSM